MAASATLALKAGVWFRRGRLLIVSPDSLGTACPLSGRNSTYRPVQILEAGSGRVVKLERLRRPKGARFFMIWGRDEADLARKLAKAKAEGDLLPGDRFDTRIWTYSSALP